MAGKTDSAQSTIAPRGPARTLRLAPRLPLAVLAIALLVGALLSSPASARVPGVAVRADLKAPEVTRQPASITVEEGQSASFEATASGDPAPSAQWEISTDGGATWSQIAGATEETLTIASAKTSEDGDEFRAVFTNVAGKAKSEAAALGVATHDYRALAWGQNSFGQLGDGSFTQSDLPVPVSGLDFVTAVAAGNRHSLALLGDGTVVAWGDGTSGQLGDGEYSSSDLPVEVEGLLDVKAIAAGQNFSLALLGDGTVMAWGANESGQLGDGSTEESDVPVPVKGLTGVRAITAGGEHALALLNGGEVEAWGNGERGQLGDGRQLNSDVPVAVKDLRDATAVSAGEEHSLALLSDGGVEAWGSNEFGQLGIGGVEEEEEEEKIEAPAEETSDVPVPVKGVSGAVAVAAGAYHSLALLSDGTVTAWGADGSGQLGDGSIEPSHEAPVAVSGLSGVSAISAGGLHSMALLSDSTVMTWGEDKYGELGDGSTGGSSDVPVAVSGLDGVVGIAAGGEHDLAYGEPLPSVSAVEPAAGPIAGGTEVTITGSDLEGATAVHFGANAARSFTVDSPTSITAVSPAGPAGTVNVTVTTPDGTSPPVPADRFSYVLAPTVTKLSSTKGPGGGGTPVTITGTNLAGATSVHFGAASAHFTVESATSIAAVAPAGAGTENVTVTTTGGTSPTSKHDKFEYTPAVEGITPDSGPATGGTSVTITGDGFAVGSGATKFEFGKKSASDVDCSSNTTCTATTPKGKAGVVEVKAEVGKVKSQANPPGDRFTYE